MRRRHDRAAVCETQHRALRGGIGSQPQARSEEVLPVLLRLERHDVGTEQPVEERIAPRKSREQLLGRERNMQEEADRLRRAEPAKLEGNASELVVVNPEQ